MSDPNDLTDDDKRKLLTDHLIEVKRLVAELPPAEVDHSHDFDEFEPPPPLGEMQSASGSPRVKHALRSLQAAETEVGIANVAVDLLAFIAAKYGITI